MSNIGIASPVSNCLFVFISQVYNSVISKSPQIIHFYKRLEDWKTVFRISNLIVAILIYASNFYLVTWASCINQIMKHNAFFLAWNTTWRYRARCFLNCKLLMVSIYCLKFIKLVWTSSLTSNTCACISFCLLERRVVSWSFQISTNTSNKHLKVLWENSRTLCNYTSEFY